MLETKRRELITAAAMQLDKTHMIRFNERTGDLNVTGMSPLNLIQYWVKVDQKKTAYTEYR